MDHLRRLYSLLVQRWGRHPVDDFARTVRSTVPCFTRSHLDKSPSLDLQLKKARRLHLGSETCILRAGWLIWSWPGLTAGLARFGEAEYTPHLHCCTHRTCPIFETFFHSILLHGNLSNKMCMMLNTEEECLHRSFVRCGREVVCKDTHLMTSLNGCSLFFFVCLHPHFF